jgi:hypothetical protein
MDQNLKTDVAYVTVTIDTNDAGGVEITCTPNPIAVGNANTLIGFSIDTDGYSFPATGAITLDAPNADFPYPSWTVADQLATLLDLCTMTDTVHYTVTVVDDETGATYSVDPAIKNGGATGS